MNDRKLCEDHAKWFGALLEELVVPIARDFMLHGLKHGEERSKDVGWNTGHPSHQGNVLAVTDSGGCACYALAWVDDAGTWFNTCTGEQLDRVIVWRELPNWNLADGNKEVPNE